MARNANATPVFVRQCVCTTAVDTTRYFDRPAVGGSMQKWHAKLCFFCSCQVCKSGWHKSKRHPEPCHFCVPILWAHNYFKVAKWQNGYAAGLGLCRTQSIILGTYLPLRTKIIKSKKTLVVSSSLTTEKIAEMNFKIPELATSTAITWKLHVDEVSKNGSSTI